MTETGENLDFTANIGRYKLCTEIKHMFTRKVISFDTGMCFALF